MIERATLDQQFVDGEPPVRVGICRCDRDKPVVRGRHPSWRSTRHMPGILAAASATSKPNRTNRPRGATWRVKFHARDDAPNAPVDVTIRGSMPPPSDHATAMRKNRCRNVAVVCIRRAGCKSRRSSNPQPALRRRPLAPGQLLIRMRARASQVAPLATAAHREDQGIGTHRFRIDSPGALPGGGGSPDVERRGKRRAEGRCLCRRRRTTKHFGRRPCERQTGPWLKPGLTFVAQCRRRRRAYSITIVRGVPLTDRLPRHWRPGQSRPG